MSKFCTHCGHENDTDARFCVSCGKSFDLPAPPPRPKSADFVPPTYIGAQWQGASGVPVTPSVPVEAVSMKTRKTLFFLAFLGLLLDFIVGLGSLLCLPIGIISAANLARYYKIEKKLSTRLLWATVVGFVGALLGGVFLFLFIH